MLIDAEPSSTSPAAAKAASDGEPGPSTGQASPGKSEQDVSNRLLAQPVKQGSGDDLAAGLQEQPSASILGGSHMPAAMHQELLAQHSDALALAQQRKEHGDSFNEIIVKVEMRKF